MKKLVFMFVAVAAISFASCGNKTEQGAPVDSDTVAAVEVEVLVSAVSAANAPDTGIAEAIRATERILAITRLFFPIILKNLHKKLINNQDIF